jgi:hypothetical protein
MKKIKIEDKVVVYRNLFTDLELKEILTLVQESENYYGKLYDEELTSSMIYTNWDGEAPQNNDKFNVINDWVPWYHFGTKSMFNENKEFTINGQSNTNSVVLRDKIKKIFFNVVQDYILDWKNSDWPKHVDSLDNLITSEVEILRHNMSPEKEYSIQLHTDSNALRYALPELETVITQLLYLNDDYEGGEVEFMSILNDGLITYKPKAGDLIVMPSGFPYLHSAKSVTKGSNKFFLRVFLSYISKGSEDYNKNVIEYGKEFAEKLENYAIKKIAEYGNMFSRKIIRDINEINSSFEWPFYVAPDKDIYIDGREIE